ncbi:MAG: UDP-glucose/GDP-mannose dehydrogenase family protein [Gammaproteobacteria bacterium]
MNISIIGSGYVGLVTGACLAEVGNAVVCADKDAEKIRQLRAGQVPLFEPGLEQLVRDNAALGRLHFTTDIARGIDHGEVIFIAVGTPPLEDGAADLRHVLDVARAIGERMSGKRMSGKHGGRRVVATKSTVPAGTADKVRAVIGQTLAERGAAAQFSVVSNPEFLKQGAAVEDFMKPDRIIIGARASDREAVEVMRGLYAPFNRNHERFLAMDTASAELTKYAANVMLAARISCMNEIANLAECVGADIESVRAGVGADPRIGYAFIYPGCGYGGSCFPKDVRALRRVARDAGIEAHLLGAVETVNNGQKYKPVEKAQAHFGDLRGKRFALWGLAFKPDTDDMREAPSRVVLEELWRHGASVQAFDPAATARARQIYGERDDLALYRDDPYQALAGADGLIVVTEWRALRAAEPARIKSELRGNVVIDARNIYEPAAIRAAGLVYYGIGRAA